MIQINLLPEELKVKAKKFTFDLQTKQIINYIFIFFGILIIIHFYLFGLFLFKNLQLKILNNKWTNLGPQRKIWEEFDKQKQAINEDIQFLQRISQKRINWGQKLNRLSLDLTSGIWFREINLNAKKLTLYGSILSLEKKEMFLIDKFIDALKKDTDFFKDFERIELSSVQTRVVGGYEITDFVLVISLKSQ